MFSAMGSVFMRSFQKKRRYAECTDETGMTEQEFLVPYHKGQVVSFLMENAMILKTEYTAAGTALTVRCDRVTADRVTKVLA